MGLLAPWFLAALGALAVPVIVHLIQKERKDAVTFPSLMFLEQVPYHAKNRQHIRHWPLLLLRCLALALLALAFAHPFISTRRAAAAGVLRSSGRDVVIALDRSYSMAYGDHWARAAAAARSTVDGLGPMDRAAVVYFTGTATAATELTDDKGALRAAIDSARPSAGVTRYGPAVRLARDIFGDSARPHREVVLISDYQRAGLGTHELPPLPTGTTLTQVNVGGGQTANVLVASASVRYDTSDGHERLAVEARLANRGAAPIHQLPVALELNGRRVQTQPVDLPANGVGGVTFAPVPTPPGLSRATVRAGTDALEPDNIYHFVVTRQPSLPVLLVNAEGADPGAALFVARALGVKGRVAFAVHQVRANQMTAASLRGVSLVVLNGAPAPGGELGRRLVQFVENGGGLLAVLGTRGGPGDWPAAADALIPRVGASMVDRGATHAATVEYVDRGHAVFEAFNAPRSGDFSAARFSRHWKLRPAKGDRTLARFDDGDAALLERRVGAGRVLVWSSDMSGAWNDLPLQPVFLPFVHQAVKYVAGYDEERPAMTVGEVLNLPALFGEGTRSREAGATRDAGSAQYVAIAPSGVQTRFTVNTPEAPASLELTEQGFYDVRRTGGAGDSARTVAANVDLGESDLAQLDTAVLAKAVAPRAEPRQRITAATADLTVHEMERGQRAWWYLLVVALILLGAETLWSNRLSRGAPKRH